jgi:hypothetical protein
MRKVLVVGLILLAVFLPLAAMPVAIFVLDVRVFAVDAAHYVSSDAPPVTFLGVTLLRAPPSA